jgi:hypothetical protein
VQLPKIKGKVAFAPKRHVVKMYGKVEVNLHEFLTTALTRATYIQAMQPLCSLVIGTSGLAVCSPP